MKVSVELKFAHEGKCVKGKKLVCLAPRMPFAEPISKVMALTNGVRGAMHAV